MDPVKVIYVQLAQIDMICSTLRKQKRYLKKWKLPFNLVSCSDDLPATSFGECGMNFEGLSDCGIKIPSGFSPENIKRKFSQEEFQK